MRLNRNIRLQIVDGAMKTLFDKGQSFIDTGAELAADCYQVALGEDVRKAAALLASAKGCEWVTCPRNMVSFSVAGQHMVFEYHLKHQKIRPIYVPRNYYNGERLGTVITLEKHAELVERVRAWQGAMQDHNKLVTTTYKSLETLVKSVGSTESLFKVWPEGAKFYTSPPLPDNPAKLPALQMQALNEALGLAA